MTIESIIRNIIQNLSKPEVPGIALLEPFNFGARHIIAQVETGLKKSSRQTLLIRLVPKSNANDEKRLYGALYRDLHAGLHKEIGHPLPEDWDICFNRFESVQSYMIDRQLAQLRHNWGVLNDKFNELQTRELSTKHVHERVQISEQLTRISQQRTETEQQIAALEPQHRQLSQHPVDAELFEQTLINLLEGPVSDKHHNLVLIIEKLSQIPSQHLQDWAWMLSRLTSQFPLKILAWGGQELHQLCSGAKQIDGFSPFQKLKSFRLGLLNEEEVDKLLNERVYPYVNSKTQTVLARGLYPLTHGHPRLIYELLDQFDGDDEEVSEMQVINNEQELYSRIAATGHVQSLRQQLENDSEAMEVMQKLLSGHYERQDKAVEKRLYWLGIISENDNEHVQLTAPAFADCLQRTQVRIS